jgi:hypothetical protein
MKAKHKVEKRFRRVLFQYIALNINFVLNRAENPTDMTSIADRGCLWSAAIFGGIHYFGTPGGPVAC